MAAQPAEFKKAPEEKIVRRGVTSGLRGLQHVSYDRYYDDLPVYGGDFVVTTDAAGGVLSTSLGQTRQLDVSTEAAVPAARAAKTSRARVSEVESASAPRLMVLAEGTGRLVYETVVTGTHEKAPTKLHVYVDAETGKVVETWDEVRDAAAADDQSHYHGTVDISTAATSMTDPLRSGVRCGGQNGSTYTGTDSAWGNGSGTNLETACVDAMYAVQKQWDMLGGWLGRNGINGSGGGFPMRVGLNQANAYWNGSYTNYGRNSAGTRQATGADVVAHENGHAVFSTTPGGAGGGNGNEKGGINESAGDIFGALTEHYMNEPANLDPPDYLVGEEVDLVGNGPIRNMYNPAALGDPNCYSSSIPRTEVHAAAGPQNHWFYLLAEGSNPSDGPASPTCDGSTVTGIGIQKAGQIFMGGLNRKVTNWSHARARVETVNAALELFPGSATECNAVKAAWSAVSVPAQSGEQPCGGGQEPPDTVFSDGFESAQGWTTDPDGTDTATAGAWERGTPQPTSWSGTSLQLAAAGGSAGLATGAAAGSAAGGNDLDGGVTTARSPAIALPAGSLSLRFSWYLAHLNNSSADDYLRVRVVGPNGSSTALSAGGAATNRAGSWQTATYDLSAYAGQSVRLVVEAADAGTASLVETGLDNVQITAS
ncbi:M4 family metallopeptidase [Actinomadura sp. 6K520]|uniref:M4 family metallopeptidase n=1 Tax=Actinomadura sp. 6K520 TaxID=2530364 RepID=UPI001050E491|nr:M4 family metallopeptidase [Actinomadura sp. 6K520]TDE16112.1 peptidase M4 family protein [Actinomadura sp. 6K520]